MVYKGRPRKRQKRVSTGVEMGGKRTVTYFKLERFVKEGDNKMEKQAKMSREDMIEFLGYEEIADVDVKTTLRYLKLMENSLVFNFSCSPAFFYFNSLDLEEETSEFFCFGEYIDKNFDLRTHYSMYPFWDMTIPEFVEIYNSIQEFYQYEQKHILDLLIEDLLFYRRVDWSKYVFQCDDILSKKELRHFDLGPNYDLLSIGEGLLVTHDSREEEPELSLLTLCLFGIQGIRLNFVRMNIDSLLSGKKTIIKIDRLFNFGEDSK